MVFLDSAGKLSRIGDAERVRRWVEATHFASPSMQNITVQHVAGD
jgi:D-alanyl-D-alanine endopeptidase (penicillin-binding protein 7)